MMKHRRLGISSMRQIIFSAVLGFLLTLVGGGGAHSDQRSREALEKIYNSSSFKAAPRDGFPVLFNPPMGTVEEGNRILQPGEWVIGIAQNGEAKAYPVDVMGFHELINDVVGGTPITVCW